MGNKAKDLTGKKFCRLTVIKQAGRYSGGNVRWECRCDCGTITHAAASHLLRGKMKSCGCWAIEVVTKHGMTHTPTYNSWVNLRFRCGNQKHPRYKYYGALGIKVCKRWAKFENFLADMGEKPKGKVLDRKNNWGDYRPGNCRWVSQETQMNNRSNTRLVTFRGKTQSIAQWAREVNLDPSLIRSRLVESGWPADKALTEPVRFSNRRVGVR